MNLFSNKPSAILYLRRQDAVLVTNSTSIRLTIPLEVVYNLEVRDAETLSDIVAQFLDEHKIHGQQIALVLDSEVVFQKQMATADSQDITKDFMNKIPFEPETKQLLETHDKDRTTLYGVNKAWYEAVAKGVRKNNKLRAVVPAQAYGVHDGKKIDRALVELFFHNTQPLKTANFLIKV
jgi:hypothetical protein